MLKLSWSTQLVGQYEIDASQWSTSVHRSPGETTMRCQSSFDPVSTAASLSALVGSFDDRGSDVRGRTTESRTTGPHSSMTPKHSIGRATTTPHRYQGRLDAVKVLIAFYSSLLWPSLLCLGTNSAFGSQSGAQVEQLVREGDLAFANRATLARPSLDGEALERAIDSYSRAVEQAPSLLTPRRRLLQALFYETEYLLTDEGDVERRRASAERACDLWNETESLLAARLELESLTRADPETVAARIRETFATTEAQRLDQPSAAEIGRLTFWGAVTWGRWAETFGRMAAVRRGVAKRVRNLGQIAELLEPTYEEAGPSRLLGRLHQVTPRVPLITGWIRRDKGIELLRRAHQRAPEDPLNRVFLAEALFAEDRNDPAIRALLIGLSERPPRPQRLVEDEAARLRAGKLLVAIEGEN